MSIVGCEGAAVGGGAALVGEGGLALDFVGIDDEEEDFCTAEGKGFGAAYLERSFETFWPF